MKTQNTYWLTILVASSVTLATLCVISLFFWYQLPLEGKAFLRSVVIDNVGFFFTAGIVLFIAFGLAADWIFRAYVKPINRMAEQINLINTVNPDLRVTINGSHDVRQLGQIINQSAEIVSNLQKSLKEKLHLAQCETENEKAILATFLSSLPQGILVCNLDGRIVFYNRKVKDLLLPFQDKDGDANINKKPWVGLGRSVYHFIDRTLIQEALERAANLLSEERRFASERFLLGIDHNIVLPAELLPVLDSQHHVTGFIVYIEDLTAKMKKDKDEAKHMQSWRHQLTQSISIIKTASEILRDEPSQSQQEYRQLVQILAEQSDLAARFWTQKDVAGKWSEKAAWPLTPISVRQWASYLSEQLAPVLSLDFTLEPDNLEASVSIDMYHMSQSVISILTKIQQRLGIDTLKASFYQEESWLYVDMIWKGKGIGDDALKQWKVEIIHGASDGRQGITVENILAYHNAKLWPHRNPDLPDNAGLRLLIPTIADSIPIDADGRMTILPESRPGYYDFNLFQQAGLSPEQDKRRLTELTYTVFDTETTGLDPSGGDEIISIGAVRIVNGRLLQEEQFNQLIDPKRHLPWASIKYHGIRPEMLQDQPTIEQVLPKFHRFVQDTILVGHNVAFDMRMLEVKESLTGIKFINPVLDTMLLSSIVHPAQESHSLSGVAERVGVSIRGRHTAMGDATATGEIFLKLLPILTQKGIHTLGNAIEASKKSFYAGLKY